MKKLLVITLSVSMMTSLLGMQQSAAKRYHAQKGAASQIDFWRSQLQANMRPLRPVNQSMKCVRANRSYKTREQLSAAYNFLDRIIVRWWESDTRYFEGTVLELARYYKKTQIICPLCRIEFSASGMLYRHFARVHRHRTGVSSYSCQHCKIVYGNRKALAAHGNCSQRFPQLEVVGEFDKSPLIRDEGENSYTVFKNSLATAARLDDFVPEDESHEDQAALDNDHAVLASVVHELCPSDNETDSDSDVDLRCSESLSDSDYETNYVQQPEQIHVQEVRKQEEYSECLKKFLKSHHVKKKCVNEITIYVCGKCGKTYKKASTCLMKHIKRVHLCYE